MRQIFLAAITTILFTSIVYADDKHIKDYYTTKPIKQMTQLSAKKGTFSASDLMPPTDITLTNASSDILYAVVPGSPVYNPFYPRTNLHIYNDYLYDDTYLVLKDPYSAPLFNGYVCRRAMITVYGQPGYYMVYIDREFCN